MIAKSVKNHIIRYLTFCLIVLSAWVPDKLVSQSLLPHPQKLDSLPGHFTINKSMSFYCDQAFKNSDAWRYRWTFLPFGGPATKRKAELAFIAIKKTAVYNPEYYRLLISSNQIKIEAYTDTGVFRALTTLRQLLPADWLITSRFPTKIPCLKIEDEPKFSYRGLHLDVCRHFFGVEFIKRYLDAMAEHKFNVFHWHLTEDQGWRIAINKYPELTNKGAWRNGSQKGRYSEHRFDSLRYGGFYTQEQIKFIVQYAKERYITVIPEIELPGHSLAALTAYPQLSCAGGPFQVAKGWGVFDDVYCAGNDSTIRFLKDVLTDVMALFPSKYIHIGGDECPKTRWKTCAKCQKRISGNGLKDEHELQSWFIREIEQFLNANNRQIIGWDEILEGGLAPNATVMSWRGTAGGEEAAKQKHTVVMTPGNPLYFDHYQSKDSTEPIAIGGYNPLKSVYHYNPLANIPDSIHRYILGAQGNVWTEYMETEKHVEYMVWPRAAALSEVLWTGERKDYPDFLNRLKTDVKRLETLKVNYAPHFLMKP